MEKVMLRPKNLRELFDMCEGICKQAIERVDAIKNGKLGNTASYYAELLGKYVHFQHYFTENTTTKNFGFYSIVYDSTLHKMFHYIVEGFRTVDYILYEHFTSVEIIARLIRIRNILEHTIESNKLLRASLSEVELNKEFEFITELEDCGE